MSCQGHALTDAIFTLFVERSDHRETRRQCTNLYPPKQAAAFPQSEMPGRKALVYRSSAEAYYEVGLDARITHSFHGP